jgi:ferrous iron transport protein A
MELNVDAYSANSLVKPGLALEVKSASGRSLADQQLGYSGVIRGLVGEVMVLDRLRELGFVSGHQITLKGRSPFGGPMIVEVNGTTVAIRRQEALCIQL